MKNKYFYFIKQNKNIYNIFHTYKMKFIIIYLFIQNCNIILIMYYIIKFENILFLNKNSFIYNFLITIIINMKNIDDNFFKKCLNHLK